MLGMGRVPLKRNENIYYMPFNDDGNRSNSQTNMVCFRGLSICSHIINVYPFSKSIGVTLVILKAVWPSYSFDSMMYLCQYWKRFSVFPMVMSDDEKQSIEWFAMRIISGGKNCVATINYHHRRHRYSVSWLWWKFIKSKTCVCLFFSFFYTFLLLAVVYRKKERKKKTYIRLLFSLLAIIIKHTHDIGYRKWI